MTTIARNPAPAPPAARRRGRLVKCTDCGHEWTSYGKGKYNRCPKCYEARTGKPWPGKGASRDPRGRLTAKPSTIAPAKSREVADGGEKSRTPGLLDRPLHKLFEP